MTAAELGMSTSLLAIVLMLSEQHKPETLTPRSLQGIRFAGERPFLAFLSHGNFFLLTGTLYSLGSQSK